MINRFALKSDNIKFTPKALILGDAPVETIPSSSICQALFFEATELEAGYLVVLKNDFKDVDIIYFHKDYQEHFHQVFLDINTQLQSETSLGQKAG